MPPLPTYTWNEPGIGHAVKRVQASDTYTHRGLSQAYQVTNLAGGAMHPAVRDQYGSLRSIANTLNTRVGPPTRLPEGETNLRPV